MMVQSGFDSNLYRERSRQQWEQTATGWHKWRPMMDDWAAPLWDRLFEVAEIIPGKRVLEVAAGDGGLSTKLAEQVGEQGYVLSTDMAERMVAFAAEAAEQDGLSNMEARVMDGENLTVDDRSFDAVVCHSSLMLFADPLKGLTEAHRVLKSGGKYAATIFTTPDRTPWLAIPAKIALQHAGRSMPPPGTPGIFALGGPGQIEQLMHDAGFTAVQSERFTPTLKLESAAECVQFVRDIAGAIKGIMAGLDEEQQDAAWLAMENTLQQFEGENGFAAPSEMLLVVGTKE